MGDWRKVTDKGNLKHNLPAGGTGQWKDTASEHQLGLTALLWTGGGGGRGGREVEREGGREGGREGEERKGRGGDTK